MMLTSSVLTSERRAGSHLTTAVSITSCNSVESFVLAVTSSDFNSNFTELASVSENQLDRRTFGLWLRDLGVKQVVPEHFQSAAVNLPAGRNRMLPACGGVTRRRSLLDDVPAAGHWQSCFEVSGSGRQSSPSKA